MVLFRNTRMNRGRYRQKLQRSRFLFRRRFSRRTGRMMARRRQKPELKYAEGFNFAGAILGNTVTTYDATPVIPQGTAKTERIGNRIKYRYYTITTWMNVIPTGPGALNIGTYRFILYSPKVALASAATFMAGLGLDRNWDTQIVQIHLDRTFNLNNPWQVGVLGASYVNGRSQIMFKKVIRFSRIVTFTQGVDNQATEPIDTLQAVFYSPVLANPLVDWSFRYKVSYIDV